MCLIAFAYKISKEYPLILIANRDEFYDRPTQKAHYWDEEMQPEILAGKDLKGGGTWFGVSKNGKWAAVTNHRDIENIKEDAPTRGDLIPNFLASAETGEEYLSNLREEASKYNGFNLLVGDEKGLFHYSNITDEITEIQPGIHGVSNALLNTPWPKLEVAKNELEDKIQKNTIDQETLFSILKNEKKAVLHQLPNTGLTKELEMAISSIFIDTKGYGTRCSTLLFIDKNGGVKFVERTYNGGGLKNREDESFKFHSL
ncbi:NRDE family protein [Brumimicrobium glaciale]|uniref:NRDE family protein n=1 Tax=Brumimicrobium glaciale TaxID=200475 RepID=A0A4Q4KQN9_9FLAO|nr:NRDE family protein [Brumimicrobium glaciale]RYM35928.1 NRDE family protein [Brumimicrobium glaciale]